jgi:hypothetical protein
MPYTGYANYVIYFSDPTEYAAAVAAGGGNGYGHCPKTASTTFGLPWPPTGGGAVAARGMYGYAPYGIPTSPGPGIEVNHPAPSGVYLKSDVDSVTVPGQASNPSGSTGQELNLVWWGTIVQVTNDLGGGVPTVTPIPLRRWSGGFETSGEGADGGNSYTNGGCRDASRTGEGLGYTIRGAYASGAQLRLTEAYRPALAPKTSWERFYLRVRALGADDCLIWRCQTHNPTQSGAFIKVLSTGALAVFSTGAAPPANLGTLVATSPTILTPYKWYLVDVLLTFPADAFHAGIIRVYLNHVLNFTATDMTGGLHTVDYHYCSTLGQQSTADAVWELDLDDWICADVPNNGGVESLDSVDWLVGSHVKRTGVITGLLTDWTGGESMMNQSINPNRVDASSMTSTTALATIEGLVDIVDDQVNPGVVLGPISAFFAGYAGSAANATGRIGYNLAGGGYVYANVTDTSTYTWLGNYFLSTGALTLPASFVPLGIIKEKSNNATSTVCAALTTFIEYIGVWGQEDDPTYPIDLSNLLFFHNCRYQNTQFALPPSMSGAPTSPVYAIGGTYVGDGLTQSIALPAPAHFIWIRALAVGSYGCKWFGASLGGGKGIQLETYGNYVIRSWVDDLTGEAYFSVGNNAVGSGEVNGDGVTYQYIAFCDPGARFNYCGVFNVNNALLTTTLPLLDATFVPEAGFIKQEVLNASGATNTLSYKGPGSAGNLGYLLSGVPVTDWGTFAAGALTVLADTITATKCGSNYSLWRTTDNDGYIAVQLTSYTGDGNALRVISLPLATGRYPLFAIVTPHDSNIAYMRDPSHTGNNSCSVSGLANSTTAIVGGDIDQIFVGVTLNTNAVDYDVFVIMGDDTGWDNGEFWPPNGPPSGDWTPPPYGPPDKPIITMEGGMNFNGAPGVLAIENISGIYTLVPNKLTDTIYTGLAGAIMEVEIPDPFFKTGYIGG